MYLSNDTLLQGGKYRIVRFIGSGGFGCTYEAEHVMLRKRVAIKEFFVKDFCNRDANTAHVTVGTQSKKDLVVKLRKKFMDEAVALSTMNHPHVVRVIDVFDENSTSYYVMDYVEGCSLKELVKRNGAMSEKQALGYIRQLCKALEYVHGLNRLHLDIKPDNILVDGQDHVVVIDFGASKQYDEEKGENTSTLVSHTPGYAPVEQLGNNIIKFMPATDIYAVGATLYKLLTGVTPPEATQLASGSVDFPPMPAHASPSVRCAIESAMQIRSSSRPQSIAEFVSLLNGEDKEDKKKQENKQDTTAPTTLSQKEKKKEHDHEEEIAREINKGENTSVSTSLSQKINIAAKVGLCAVLLLIVCDALFRVGVFSLVHIFLLLLAILLEVLLFLPKSAGKDVGNKNVWSSSNQKSLIGILIGTGLIIIGLFVWKSMNETKGVVQDMSFTNSIGTTFVYTGAVNDAKQPHGQGEGDYPAGHYAGQYVNGLREGQGTFVTANGTDTFIGTFRNDEYGRGKIVIVDGSYFIGAFIKNQPYEGEWYTADGKLESVLRYGRSK